MEIIKLFIALIHIQAFLALPNVSE